MIFNEEVSTPDIPKRANELPVGTLFLDDGYDLALVVENTMAESEGETIVVNLASNGKDSFDFLPYISSGPESIGVRKVYKDGDKVTLTVTNGDE